MAVKLRTDVRVSTLWKPTSTTRENWRLGSKSGQVHEFRQTEMQRVKCWPEWCLRVAIGELGHGANPDRLIESILGSLEETHRIMYCQFKHNNKVALDRIVRRDSYEFYKI